MTNSNLKNFISGYSIEVVPNSAAKVESFAEILPKNTRVYIAHLSEKEDIKTMVATAKRISGEGFSVMPHIPARIIKDKATLVNWISMYRNEANVTEALLIGGGASHPLGNFDSSIQLIESGAFDDAGFKRLHIAGHPEGSKDIDPDGSNANVSSALSWKQERLPPEKIDSHPHDQNEDENSRHSECRLAGNRFSSIEPRFQYFRRQWVEMPWPVLPDGQRRL